MVILICISLVAKDIDMLMWSLFLLQAAPYSSMWIMSTVAMSQPMGQASPMGW